MPLSWRTWPAFRGRAVPLSTDEIKAEATAVSNAEFDALVAQARLEDEALEQSVSEAADATEPSVDDEPVPDATPTTDFFPTQGGTAFAVYVDLIEVSESSGDPGVDFAETVAFFEDEGVDVFVGSLDCDEGAVEGLGLPVGDYFAAAAYFESIEDADAFAAAFEIPADEVIEIRTFCVD